MCKLCARWYSQMLTANSLMFLVVLHSDLSSVTPSLSHIYHQSPNSPLTTLLHTLVHFHQLKAIQSYDGVRCAFREPSLHEQ